MEHHLQGGAAEPIGMPVGMFKTTHSGSLIDPSYAAWEAAVLSLNKKYNLKTYTYRITLILFGPIRFVVPWADIVRRDKGKRKGAWKYGRGICFA